MPASALAEGQISELADVRASATVPVIDVAVSLSPEADGGGLLMDNADASAGIDVNHLSEMGSIAGEVSFDNNSNTSVRLARIESDATSLNSYFTGTSGDIASFKMGSYDELSWSPQSGAKTVYELTASDAADPSAGMVIPWAGSDTATLSLNVSGLTATSSAREAAKDPASARDLMSLTWVFEAAQTTYEQPGGIRDQIAAITPNTTATVEIGGKAFYVLDKMSANGHNYALLFGNYVTEKKVTFPDYQNVSAFNSGNEALHNELDTTLRDIKPYVVTGGSIGDGKWTKQYNSIREYDGYLVIKDFAQAANRLVTTLTLMLPDTFSGNKDEYPLTQYVNPSILRASENYWLRCGEWGNSVYVPANTDGSKLAVAPCETYYYGLRPMCWVLFD